MSERMTDERLDYLRQLARLQEKQMRECPPSSFTVPPFAEAVAEIDRLRAYEADAADRFAAVVRQRDAAEAEVRRLLMLIADHDTIE